MLNNLLLKLSKLESILDKVLAMIILLNILNIVKITHSVILGTLVIFCSLIKSYSFKKNNKYIYLAISITIVLFLILNNFMLLTSNENITNYILQFLPL